MRLRVWSITICAVCQMALIRFTKDRYGLSPILTTQSAICFGWCRTGVMHASLEKMRVGISGSTSATGLPVYDISIESMTSLLFEMVHRGDLPTPQAMTKLHCIPKPGVQFWYLTGRL